jgi:hypothetical protein
LTLPSNSDFILYDGTLFDNTDWVANFQKIVTILTNGNYDFNINQITASTYVGLPATTFTATAGEDITDGDVIRLSAGSAYKATNATSTGIEGVCGIAKTTTSTAGTVTITFDYDETLSGLTVGQRYYVGVNGAITTTAPAHYPMEIGTAVSTTRMNLNFQEEMTPTGTIIPYSKDTAPPGYILLNGSNLNRTTHARLFALWGTMYGVGDGSTTFGIPDLRGQFLRGIDSGAGVDPDASTRTDRGDGTTGDNVGTKQTDLLNKQSLPRYVAESSAGGGYTRTDLLRSSGSQPGRTATTYFDTNSFLSPPGDETRPINTYVNYCAKL